MKKLNGKQEQAIILLAQGNLSKEVAKEVDVAPQTISEWKKIPEFMAELNDFRYQMLESSRSQLQYITSKAVDTLVDLMDNASSDEVRRKSALDILRMAGFEAGRHECYGWGIGQRDVEKITHEMNGTLDLHTMLSLSGI